VAAKKGVLFAAQCTLSLCCSAQPLYELLVNCVMFCDNYVLCYWVTATVIWTAVVLLIAEIAFITSSPVRGVNTVKYCDEYVSLFTNAIESDYNNLVISNSALLWSKTKV